MTSNQKESLSSSNTVNIPVIRGASPRPPVAAEKKKEKHGRQGEGGGHPSKKTGLDLGMIETLYGFGLIDEQIAKALDISTETINQWKKDEKFSVALKNGKAISDARVERSLYDRATGYSHLEDDIRVIDGAVVITPTIKHYPPDPTSMIFWLKNRKKAEWRDKVDVEHGGGIKIASININLVAGSE